jgi:hypothetical protein
MPNFNFKSQFPISEVIAAAQRKPQMEAEMQAQQEQAKQLRLKSLLDALSTGAQFSRAMSQNKTEGLARQQVQSQAQGQQELSGILAEPQPTAPVAAPIQQFGRAPVPMQNAGDMVPTGTVQPTFGDTAQGGSQDARMKAAAVKAFPDAAGKDISASLFGDPLDKSVKMAQVHKLMTEAKNGSVDAKSKLEGQLRDDFVKASSQFADVSQSFQRMQDSFKEPSAAGDLALIFNYMKMLDPGSTVREGEFASAQNSGGLDSRLRAKYNSIINGERLDPKQRDDFFRRAGLLYGGQTKLHGQREGEYRRIAKNSGIDADNVIVQLRSNLDLPMPPAPGAGAGQVVNIGSIEEANKLPPGTRFSFNGRTGTVQ